MPKTDRFLLLVLALSLSANICLMVAWHRAHSSEVALTTEFNTRTLPSSGANFGELRLLSLEQKMNDPSLGDNKMPVVVYVFSPTCKWCERNQSGIGALATQIKGKYRLIGVSNTSNELAQYLAHISPPFPVYYLDPNSQHPNLPMSVTPQTLVFSPDGAYIVGWNGAYMQATRNEISSFFKVSLPELR